MVKVWPTVSMTHLPRETAKFFVNVKQRKSIRPADLAGPFVMNGLKTAIRWENENRVHNIRKKNVVKKFGFYPIVARMTQTAWPVMKITVVPMTFFVLIIRTVWTKIIAPRIIATP